MRQLLFLVPGIGAAAGVMLAASWAAEPLGAALLRVQGLPAGPTPVPAVPVAIVMGLLLRHGLALPAALDPGLRVALGPLLRLGIVCVGIKLSFVEVLALGSAGAPAVVAVVAAGLVFVPWFNRRMGLPPRLGTLVAAGTSICGVTAIVSTAPAIRATDREVAYAVANIVLFGLAAMLVYPHVAPRLLRDPATLGVFLGTAIHDTSQVVGAALTAAQLTHDDLVLRVATVTKLTRNLALAVVVPLLAWRHLRETSVAGAAGVRLPRRTLVPGFVLGFVTMAIVRTAGDAAMASRGAIGVLDAEGWAWLTHQVGDVWGARVLLGTAMAAVGLNTRASVFRGVGVRPFAVGLAGAAVVALVGLAVTSI